MYCEVPGCNRKVHAKGMCNAHYARKVSGWSWRRMVYTPIKERKPVKCSVKGCTNAKVTRRGLCGYHYRVEREAEIHRIQIENALELGEITLETAMELDRIRLERMELPSTCNIPGCNRETFYKGMCNGHYHRAKRGYTYNELVNKPIKKWDWENTV